MPRIHVVSKSCGHRSLPVQVAQLSQRDHAAGWVSFARNIGPKWKDTLHQTLLMPEN